jgi:hypothetical protein
MRAAYCARAKTCSHIERDHLPVESTVGHAAGEHKMLNKLSVFVAGVGAFAFAGCSSQSPASPSTPVVAVGDVDARAPKPAPGTYLLSFLASVNGTLQEVTSLPVSSEELILKAYVASSSGQPAQDGTVTFEYCSYKGGPRNDITRPDEAPKEACEQGTASWVRLTSLSVNAGSCPALGTGYACMDFGIVRIPRDVGFRFRYSPQGTQIPSGTSEAKNFTWVAAS